MRKLIGILGGGAGIGLHDLHRTDDGGKSWRVVATTGKPPDWHGNLPASAYLTDMFFLDGEHGWLGDTKGGIRTTRDGGATWDVLRYLADSIDSMQFFTPDRGYMVQTQFYRRVSVLVRTMDGGRSWQPVYSLVPANPADIKVVSNDLSVAAGTITDPGAILLRAGSDPQWRQVGTLPGLKPGATVRAISFSDPQNGWALIHGGPLLRTTDGARTWRAVNPTHYAFTSMDFVDQVTGYASEQGGGSLLRTRDGGATFEVVLGSVTGARFVSRDRGWTVKSGELSATADGGATWQAVTPLPAIVREFDFQADGTGLALAGNRDALSLYATPDGGKTWTWIDLGDIKPSRIKLLGAGRAWLWDSLPHGYYSEDGFRTWKQIQ
ncbi:MAG: hypothetical protein JWN15_702 [Firmicutes bacterium]|nr:hypothetical protein [Bacillota bacterium]